MKLGFILITGVFFNMLMASIFPTLLLDTATANSLLEGDTLGYDFTNNPYFTEDYKSNVGDYIDNTKADNLEELSATDTGLITSTLEAASSFFDGLLDALTKLKTYLSFLVPYSTLFFVMPGAFGLVFGGVYSVAFAYATIRFIRGA